MVAQLTDSTIQTAVNAWILDSNQAQFTNAGNTPYYGPIAGWDTSQVTNMRNLFFKYERFNDALTNWDTSKVTNMRYMFFNCIIFK